MLKVKLRAHLLQSGKVLVDGASSDGTAAGQRNLGFSLARQQRAEAEHGSAHGLHEVVGRLDAHLAVLHGNGSLFEHRLASKDIEELDGGLHVPEVGHVGEGHIAVNGYGGHDDGKSGVLGAAHSYGAFERNAALYKKTVQFFLQKCQIDKKSRERQKNA